MKKSSSKNSILSDSRIELVDEYSNSPVSDVQAKNSYLQVKFIKCYLREIISFTKKMTLETGASLGIWMHLPIVFFFKNEATTC